MKAASRRVGSLDVLRGVAITGTLLSNIGTFVALSMDVPVYMLGGRSEKYVEQLTTIVVNGKFLALLSILFGVGMAIQREFALRQGRRWPWRYEWRSLLLLLVDGFIHFAFVVDFDVLMGYALVSMVIALLLLLRTLWLVAAAVTAGSVHLTLEFRSLRTETSFGDSWQDDSMPTTYFGEVAHRMANFWEMREALVVFSAPLTAFLFLSGAPLWRAGLFRGTRGRTC